jgi:hypothetical protein
MFLSYFFIVILVNDTTYFIVLWVNILSSLTYTHRSTPPEAMVMLLGVLVYGFRDPTCMCLRFCF